MIGAIGWQEEIIKKELDDYAIVSAAAVCLLQYVCLLQRVCVDLSSSICNR